MTRETHGLGEFTSGWKRPGLRECTAQEFAYDFFKFHEQRGEFDYENVWEYVLVRSRLMFFMIIYGGRHREMRSFFFAQARPSSLPMGRLAASSCRRLGVVLLLSL